MLFKSLKERSGFVLVIAIFGLGTAFLVGSDVIAAAIAVLAGLVFLAARARTAENGADQAGDSKRPSGAPFTYLFAWQLSGVPDLEPTIRWLAELGLEVDKADTSDAGLSFYGGSQIRTRLFGAILLRRETCRFEEAS